MCASVFCCRPRYGHWWSSDYAKGKSFPFRLITEPIDIKDIHQYLAISSGRSFCSLFFFVSKNYKASQEFKWVESNVQYQYLICSTPNENHSFSNWNISIYLKKNRNFFALNFSMGLKVLSFHRCMQRKIHNIFFCIAAIKCRLNYRWKIFVGNIDLVLFLAQAMVWLLNWR